ncbi:MAG: DUF5698 domain-containing protein [Candidatus Glassbacteria bacterium]
MERLFETLNAIPLALPLAIMCARIVDVSIGTVRMIMVIRGRRITAAALGFFEVTIWLAAITGIISHITNWVNFIFYGIGFALGNVVGMFIESKMAVGQQVVRYISSEASEEITRVLRSRGYGVTEFSASGREGPVGLGLVILSRKKVPDLISIISAVNPKTVVTIEDVRYSNVVEYYKQTGGTFGRSWFAKKK